MIKAVIDTNVYISGIFFSGAPRRLLEAVLDVCRDSEDHIILECAVQSHADFIVTGDKDLLVLKEFLGTRIVAPADFLSIIDRE
jgi:predicted nucleic acid-binding protein